MEYKLSSEQKILRESAHKFLAKECTSDFVREMAVDQKGFSDALWDKMAELGWMSLLIPEEYNGSGVNFVDLTVLLSEMGQVCLPGPFFSSVVQGGLAVLGAGSEEQKKEILSGLADGKRKLTLAWIEEEGQYTLESVKLTAEQRDDDFVLSGNKLFVQDAHVADTIICAARTGDRPENVSLFLVDSKSAGMAIQLFETMAGDKQCEVSFNQVKVPKANLLGEVNQGGAVLEKVLLKSAVAKCAEMNGGAKKVLDMAVDYAKGRKQFGRPIGAFQAVQHHCANMLTYADTIKYLMFQAAWKIDSGQPFEMEASICKAWGSDSYRKLVALGHQIIGGMSFMEEYDLQLYFKQAKTAEQIFGNADFHREIVAREMGM
ncbi:MAG: acyl-CoA/acyl-ACP dehydrogenase [Deltaproteobacteria bacterium]|jgi:3-oxocholest-4-en-26-oyl-CoA dehydrogenase beta subunit|nr:acyl-CoA/acyl-ACP dehydrogenase [Deltaproteobacteria bacterium]MBT4263094.1 acyl-CoA/acyl-ACP dehydrogenase [Deltaproteobacteria bacterium]MBT4643445.1 acyl-CoA/acyl-ACP dehydrogenase [Deltaproteobacteria bacterium]MBT7151585.1 acyl-CoA/acyl-ACP dehydrogenase [Deltaproteobacteria bacterium]MBT7713880.1 acyl-CoA/acyl-ACP dehydrogenase [Deltaproteobacteria bacterium]